jgi:hypothetical protein
MEENAYEVGWRMIRLGGRIEDNAWEVGWRKIRW